MNSLLLPGEWLNGYYGTFIILSSSKLAVVGQFKFLAVLQPVVRRQNRSHIQGMPHRHPIPWAAAIAILLALFSDIGAPYFGLSLLTRNALSIAIFCVLVVGLILGVIRHRGLPR